MAAPVQTGMDKGEMKKLLARSKQEPVNCAIGLGPDPSVGLLLLDRVKQPKAVEAALAKQVPDAKNTRFGRAFVDTDDDPKLVKILLNKPVSGMARKLVKTLKGTGFTKVEILLDDGSPVESYTEEDVPQAAAADAPEGAVPPPPPPPPEDAPKPDPAAVEARLKALIPRVAALGPADPRREDLAKRARQAGILLKTGNLVYAAAEIESLGRALDEAPATPPGTAADGATDGGTADYAKSGKIWLATRKRVEDELGKLRGSLLAAYGGDPAAGEIAARFADRTAPLLQTLDGALADALDDAAAAKDPAGQAKAVDRAKALIARYEAYAGGDALLADLDANPFVPLAIQKTLTATLAALSKTLR